MLIGTGYTNRFLSEAETRDVFARGIAQLGTAGKRVLVIIPDSTRSGPIPLCFHALCELMQGNVAKLDFMIALGTHMPMPEDKFCQHVGITLEERRTKYRDVGLLNHNWEAGLVTLGTIPAAEIAQLTGGLMSEDVPIEINEHIFDYDQLIICGPVFPHEVVGFSGGNKYFFPGISGSKVIDFTHWMSAIITNLATIGHQDTPTRRVINKAAAMIPVPRACFSMVVKGHDDLAGLYFGTPEEAQVEAAKLSAQVNITYVDKPFKLVISIMPSLYDDIWTAAKGMYKMEPVVADGGTLIIYAPHIDEISYTHGKNLDRAGYHVRDYYLAHMPEMLAAGIPRGVMAHGMNCRGVGTYVNGVEKSRINVVLATGIPQERCERIHLGYMDPATLDIESYKGREAEGILVVPRAGELLYRIKQPC